MMQREVVVVRIIVRINVWEPHKQAKKLQENLSKDRRGGEPTEIIQHK